MDADPPAIWGRLHERESNRHGPVRHGDVNRSGVLHEKDLAKLSLYLGVLADLGDIKTLVEFATDEISDEMGLIERLAVMLETAAASEAIDPEARFAAPDGLAFEAAAERLAAMERLVAEYQLDDQLDDEARLACDEGKEPRGPATRCGTRLC